MKHVLVLAACCGLLGCSFESDEVRQARKDLAEAQAKCDRENAGVEMANRRVMQQLERGDISANEAMKSIDTTNIKNGAEVLRLRKRLMQLELGEAASEPTAADLTESIRGITTEIDKAVNAQMPAGWKIVAPVKCDQGDTSTSSDTARATIAFTYSFPRWISYKRSTEAWRTSVRKTGLQWQRRRRVLLQQVEAREGQVAEWKTFAATAIARTKQRAGRPLKPQPARDGEIPENVALVPSIEQLLVVQLPMAAVNSEKTSLALFETFDRNRDRKLTRGEAYEHSPLFAMAEACDLDGAPESVSQREWILIVRVVRRQTGGGTRAAETLQLLLEGPKAILRQNPMPGRPGAR